MADISKITTLNGTTYNIKDATARSSIPAAASSNPLMDGTVAVGTSAKYAREDHRHPVDTSRAAANHTHSADNIVGGYLNIHPENGPTLIPFIHNDIAFLLKRGGSAIIKYDGTAQSLDISNVFDGSGSYQEINPTGVTTITIELTLYATFHYGNTIYVDFGSTNWRSKSVKIEVMNSNYSDDVWTQKYSTTTNSLGHVYVWTSHKPVGASNTGGGFNKIRFTFSDWATATIFRISQLGVYNYGSSGVRQTYMSRGIDDYVFRDITPNSSSTYSLGDSSHKWKNIYADTLNGTTIPSTPKFTDTTYESKAAASGGTDVSLVTTGEKYTWNHKGSGTITGIKMNGASKGTSGVVDLGTVITAHQDISGKADKSATVSTVAYDSTNKKLTKTINGTTSDIVTVATLKTDLALVKGDVGLGNVENKSSATIRGELTKANVTDALGYTPPTSDTNTHRPIQVNGTEVLGNNTTALNLKAGSNVSISNSSGTVTIAATDTTYSSKTAASGGTDVSLVTTGEKYTWNNKLSSHQTIKQDGITGATVNRFGTCSTAAATAAKAVSITSGTFSLEAGARVAVKFSNANTANSPTLNVNSKGAKNIFHKGSQITSGGNKALLAGICDFIYDGTQWHLVGNYIDTNTTYTANTSKLVTTTVPNVTSVGSAPTLGTAIPADDITEWSAGSTPTLGTAIPADDITAWTTNTPTAVSVSKGVLTLTSGSKASLSYTAKSIPNVTSVGSVPTLKYTAKSIPNVTSVGSAPTLGTAITVATGSLASDGSGGTVATGIKTT